MFETANGKEVHDQSLDISFAVGCLRQKHGKEMHDQSLDISLSLSARLFPKLG